MFKVATIMFQQFERGGGVTFIFDNSFQVVNTVVSTYVIVKSNHNMQTIISYFIAYAVICYLHGDIHAFQFVLAFTTEL